jgi:hypothetical protein
MRKTALLALVLLLMEVLLVGVVVQESWVRKVIGSEQALTRTWIGEQAAARVKDRADRWFRAAFIETGVMDGSHRLFLPTEEERRGSQGLEDLGSALFAGAEERLRVGWTMAYQVLVRFAQILLWAPYLLLLLVPAVTDGLLMRQRKKHGFHYASPILHRCSLYAFLGGFYAVVLLLFAPVVVPPVLVPAIAAVTAASAGVGLSNLQKRL